MLQPYTLTQRRPGPSLLPPARTSRRAANPQGCRPLRLVPENAGVLNPTRPHPNFCPVPKTPLQLPSLNGGSQWLKTNTWRVLSMFESLYHLSFPIRALNPSANSVDFVFKQNINLVNTNAATLVRTISCPSGYSGSPLTAPAASSVAIPPNPSCPQPGSQGSPFKALQKMSLFCSPLSFFLLTVKPKFLQFFSAGGFPSPLSDS